MTGVTGSRQKLSNGLRPDHLQDFQSVPQLGSFGDGNFERDFGARFCDGDSAYVFVGHCCVLRLLRGHVGGLGVSLRGGLMCERGESSHYQSACQEIIERLALS